MNAGRTGALPAACSSCGEWREIRNKSRGWCDSCYQRWIKGGKPESGPPRRWANRKPRVRTCAGCGLERLINGKEMCRSCYSAWYRENLPVRTCAGCGLERKLHVEDFCLVCYRRRRRDYDAEASARQKQRDRLDILRVAWTVTHPEESGNPYECGIDGCHATANPAYGYLCMKHFSRIYRTGRHDRDPCVRCGGELNGRSGSLCSGCYRTWRYCDQPSHQGARLLPAEEFAHRTNTSRSKHGRGASCKGCYLRSIRKCRCKRCDRDRIRNGGSSLCEECSREWFYCASAVHDGERLLPLDATVERGNSNRRCKQCSVIRQKGRPRKILPCQACGEEKPIQGRGWCGACYRRWLVAGRPDAGPPPSRKRPQADACTACGKPGRTEVRGWCGACYSRWLYAGRPTDGPPVPSRALFRSSQLGITLLPSRRAGICASGGRQV